ncbi:MAG: DUF3857 domain-containing protein [Candidatus Acidiferrum sp.]|jgi:hypothetical protein
MKALRAFLSAIPIAAALCFFAAAAATPRNSQDASQKPAQKAPEKAPDKSPEKSATKPTPKLPSEIELLETTVRFEADGASRKEVHARVKINDELGARQFARLNFNFNRAFEQIEIPLVRITHASGGTADVLPSAITDIPNPAVVNAPAYQDVRVKSVRILGLEPGDSLEYRVITTISHPPLAPDFSLEHSFDRTGVVLNEQFQVDLPTSVLAKTEYIVIKSQATKQQLAWRLYPDQHCGFCVEPTIESVDPALLAQLPLSDPKKTKPEKAPTKPAEASPSAPPPPADDPLPPPEFGKVQLLLKPTASDVSVEKSGEAVDSRTIYTWHHAVPQESAGSKMDSSASDEVPDIQAGKISSWAELSYNLYLAFRLPTQLPDEVIALSQHLTEQASTPLVKTQRIYDFVSQKIKTVDLPLGATGFKSRPLPEIISSGYATQEDKFFLFQALAKAAGLEAGAALIGSSKKFSALVPSPAAFAHLLIGVVGCNCWLDPSLEVAPFGALPAPYRGSASLIVGRDDGPLTDLPPSPMVGQIPNDLPFASTQRVDIDAALSPEGKLTAKVHYAMRGDNELLLRVAFHQAPKEKQNEVAQLLALSDGFRGKILSTTTSDPYATKEPFKVEYEIEQPKLVDWSKKTIRIPALLPLLGVPDPPSKSTAGAAPSPIDLGTPLDVIVSVTLHLPPGTTIQVPAGTSVQRDFATYSSQYSAKEASLLATRHLNFILKEISADRAADYIAFFRTVQNDESQSFTLERQTADATTPTPTPAPASPAKPQKP